MSQINIREIVLLNGTFTTTGKGPDINAIMGWQAATVSVAITASSGTLPTLDVYIQKRLTQVAATDQSGALPTGAAIYDDLLHFTQMTSTPTRIANVTISQTIGTANQSLGTGNDWANSNQALGANALRVGPLGAIWAVAYVIGGTTPSFTFSVTAQLIPYKT